MNFFSIYFNANEISYYYYYCIGLKKFLKVIVILYIYTVIWKHTIILYNMIIIIIIIRRSCYDHVLRLQRSAEPRHDRIMFLVYYAFNNIIIIATIDRFNNNCIVNRFWAVNILQLSSWRGCVRGINTYYIGI